MTKTLALGVGALALTVTLAGCSIPTSDAAPQDKPTATSKPTQKPSDEPTPEKKEAPKGDGKSVAPGETVSGAGVLPLQNHEGKNALFSHEVTDISPAPQADVDAIVAKVPKAKGFEVYYLTIQSHFVSGEAMPYSSFYTNFDPVDADGEEIQSISLIGWDGCPSESIPNPGDDPSATITNCVAALVVPGQPKPAGVQWAPYDSDYDAYKGKPAFILKG